MASGCYLAHVAGGQWRLLRARTPVERVLHDPATPEDLRERLALVESVRRFATGLGLAVDRQYTSYAPWPGDRVVTAVVATRPGEVEPAGFWFPVVGRVPYKSYFDPDEARAEAAELRAQGMDVCLAPVPAYSTLGWFEDPVTTPMLRESAGDLVETLLHELVHATVFVSGDADFDEGLATFVGQEASVRFFAARDGAASPAAREQRDRVSDERAISELLLDLRSGVAALYAHEPAGPARDAAREGLESLARTRLAALPLHTQSAPELAAKAGLNDACLALEGAYTADLPRYAARLAALGGDLPALLAAAEQAAHADDPRTALLGPAPAGVLPAAGEPRPDGHEAPGAAGG